MFKYLFLSSLLFFNYSLMASETKINPIEIKQTSEQAVYESELECRSKFRTGLFQHCWLSLFYDDKLVKDAKIFIGGGMPIHQHGLPTSPKITWSDEKNAYLIHGLKFSMPGEWELNFRVNAEDKALKDEITIQIKVD